MNDSGGANAAGWSSGAYAGDAQGGAGHPQAGNGGGKGKPGHARSTPRRKFGIPGFEALTDPAPSGRAGREKQGQKSSPGGPLGPKNSSALGSRPWDQSVRTAIAGVKVEL